jgi:membrane protease subunit HflC
VRHFDRRLLIWDGDPNQIPTLGREFISVDTTARWRIVDPLEFLKSVRDEAGANSRLNDIIDSVVRDKISNTELEEIVRSKDWRPDPTALEEEVPLRTDVDLTAPTKMGREQLTREILNDAQKGIAPLGIELIDVRIKRLNYIDEVRSKVEDRMIAERQRVAEQFRSEGAGRSAEIDGETEREQRRILSDGQRRAEEIRGKADAEATRIYGEVFGADPEFYAFFRTLENYSRGIGENSTLMLRADSDFFEYLEDIGTARRR